MLNTYIGEADSPYEVASPYYATLPFLPRQDKICSVYSPISEANKHDKIYGKNNCNYSKSIV